MSGYRKNKTKEPEINELKTRYFSNLKYLHSTFYSISSIVHNSSMSVWHTGNNLPEHNYIPPTKNMNDQNNNTNATLPMQQNANQHTLETLLADYNQISVYNNHIFTQCLFAIFSMNPEKCENWSQAKFKALKYTPEPVEAKSYREHREMKVKAEPKVDSGWGDEISTSSRPSNNGWEDDASFSSGNRGYGGGSRGGGGNNNGGGRQGRAEDWACTKCDYKTNYGTRNECFKCKEPREDGGGAPRGGARPRREPRPDDWACTSCDYKTNFGNRNECFKCHEPKSDSGSGGSGSTRKFGNKRSFDDDNKVSSGWSDDESDAKKPKLDENTVKPSGDDWDDEPAAAKVEKKTVENSAVCDDEW